MHADHYLERMAIERRPSNGPGMMHEAVITDAILKYRTWCVEKHEQNLIFDLDENKNIDWRSVCSLWCCLR